MKLCRMIQLIIVLTAVVVLSSCTHICHPHGNGSKDVDGQGAGQLFKTTLRMSGTVAERRMAAYRLGTLQAESSEVWVVLILSNPSILGTEEPPPWRDPIVEEELGLSDAAVLGALFEGLIKQDDIPTVILLSATYCLDDEREGVYTFDRPALFGRTRHIGGTPPIRVMARDLLVRVYDVDFAYDADRWRLHILADGE